MGVNKEVHILKEVETVINELPNTLEPEKIKILKWLKKSKNVT